MMDPKAFGAIKNMMADDIMPKRAVGKKVAKKTKPMNKKKGGKKGC